jgi:hypothetical protein
MTRKSPRATAIPGKTAAITAITLNTTAITADIAWSAPYSAETTAITANTTAITPITADIADIIARTEDIPNAAIITANRGNITVGPATARRREARVEGGVQRIRTVNARAFADPCDGSPPKF